MPGTRVTCEDIDTGETGSVVIENNHVVIVDGDRYIDGVPVSGECVDPSTVGLIARPSRTAPGESIWGGDGGGWYDEPRRVDPDAAFIDPDEWAYQLETARRDQKVHDECGPDRAAF